MLTWDKSRVTAAMWWAWKQIDALEQLGPVTAGEDAGDDSGIYAFKPHYHSTVDDNLTNWPWSYSVQDAVDLQGPRDKARAIDWKLSPENMRKYTERIRKSGTDPKDPRGAKTLRNVFGTLDGRTVYGWNFRDSEQTSSDPSHLWHKHFEFTTAVIESYPAMRELLSILRGETVTQWQQREKRLAAAGLTDTPTWDTEIPPPDLEALMAGPSLVRKGPKGQTCLLWAGGMVGLASTTQLNVARKARLVEGDVVELTPAEWTSLLSLVENMRAVSE